jgi:hypothetical protein
MKRFINNIKAVKVEVFIFYIFQNRSFKRIFKFKFDIYSSE